MKNLLLFILIHVSIIGYSQTYIPKPTYPELFKQLVEVNDSDPEWIHLMYADEIQYFELMKSYNLYYKNHLFVKTEHTQNYKYMMSLANSHVFDYSSGTLIKKELTTHSSTQLAKVATSYTWEFAGPKATYEEGGEDSYSVCNIFSFSQSLTNPDILFAGSQGSTIYKSTDKGQNWAPVGTNMMSSGDYIYAIEIDPTNEDIVYAAAGTKKFLKTTNGGDNWNQLHSNNDGEVHQIIINPLYPDTLFTAGEKGITRSFNGGSSWSTVLDSIAYDIQFNTSDPSVLYAAVQNTGIKVAQIMKSTDNGDTWELKSNGWFEPSTSDGIAVSTSAIGAKIAVTDADPNRIYSVLLGNDNDITEDANFIDIYRSDDGGETWYTPEDMNKDGFPDNSHGGPYGFSTNWNLATQNSTPLGSTTTQGFYNCGIAVSDVNPDYILYGGLNLYASFNGGEQYEEYGGYKRCTSCGNDGSHPDIQEIVMNGDDVWVASDGGVDLYDASFAFQDHLNKGLESDYWGFDQGWNYDVLVGGRYHNGDAAHYDNYGEGNFIDIGGSESPTGYVYPGNERQVYHEDIGGYLIPEDLTGNVTQIDDYSKYPNESRYILNVGNTLVYHPHYWDTFFLGLGDDLWVTKDNGQTFTLLKAFGGFDIVDIVISRNDPKKMAVTTWDEFWRTLDGGLTWESFETDGSTNTRFYQYLTLSENDVLFWSFFNANSIHASTDFGETWIEYDAQTVITDIKYVHGTNNGMLLQTHGGDIYYGDIVNDSWQNITTTLDANNKPLRMEVFYRDSKLRFASNRGIWETELQESIIPFATPMTKDSIYTCTTTGSTIDVSFEDFSILDHTNATWSWSINGHASVDDSTKRNPTFTFNSDASYDVTLTVENDNGSSTMTIENMITISGCGTLTSLGESNIVSPSVYPNPTIDILKTSFQAQTPYVIIDSEGRILMDGNYSNMGINISHLKPSTYFIKSKDRMFRFTKQK